MYVEGTYELDLEDRSHAIVARVLVDLSVKEPGENWIGETFNGRPFELPATWVQQIPDKGLLTLQYTVESWAIKRKVRASWMKFFQVGEFDQSKDDDFLGYCSCKLLPLLHSNERNTRVDLGWLKLRNAPSGEINVALFVDSSATDECASNEQQHQPLERRSSILSTDLPEPPNEDISRSLNDEIEDTIEQHGGWRQGGNFVFGVHVIAGRNL
jgi:hypothetical protein